MDEVIGDRYEVLGPLGEGALGEVFRIRDRETDEIQALKLLRPDVLSDTALGRFRAEFRTIQKLAHRNIVHVYDFGVHEGEFGSHPYFTMELLHGSDLGHWANGNRPRPDHPGYEVYSENVAYVFHQVADALGAVHAQGIVHRDIKPENVFIRPGRHPRARLLDFGHARDNEGENLTQTGTVLGTAYYIPPEQAMGKPPAPAADIYSLGCVMFEALTGAPPYTGDSVVHVLLGHIQKPVPDPREVDPRVPAHLAELCMRLMSKEPGDRAESANQLALELAAS